jgi:hypothetical protein
LPERSGKSHPEKATEDVAILEMNTVRNQHICHVLEKEHWTNMSAFFYQTK